MNTLEQLIYLQHTKSGIRSFESFVDSLIKHDDVVSDAELVHTMQRISKQYFSSLHTTFIFHTILRFPTGKKLQTVMSKWDYKLPKLAPIETPEVPSPSPDDIVCFKKHSRSSTSSSSREIDPKPGCSYNSNTTNYEEEKSLMIVFKDINESLIVGPNGFYVEEITTGFWKCNSCDANNLPLNNLLAHLNGKTHKKKINFK